MTRSFTLTALSVLLCVEAQVSSLAKAASESVAIKSTGRLMRHASLHAKEHVALADVHKANTKLLKGVIKAGICKNFEWGSSYLGHEQNDDWFTDVPDEEHCAQQCDDDPACEQAQYYALNRSCYVGVAAMTEEPTHDYDVYCYAKHGFSYTWPYTVLEGMCQGFFPGFDYDGEFPLARQCHEHDTNELLGLESWEHDERCHHWGPEFELSERGCWGRCQANPNCLTAEYEAHKADCKLGLLPMMAHNTFRHRCAPGSETKMYLCQSKCFSKYGEGNTTGSRGHSLDDMYKLLRNEFPAHMHTTTTTTGVAVGEGEE